MKIRSNVHTHTTFCDGKNSVEEMALAAIDLGFVSLGYSIHGWTPYEPTPVTLEKEALYRDEVRRVREKYRDQIEILLGAERDALYPRDFSQYEYLIDSTHCILADGEHVYIDYSAAYMEDAVRRHFGGDYYAYCRAYFRREAEVCAQSDATFIGHIDLVSKYNEGNRYFDEADPRYLGPALEAVECAVRRGLPIEMNTGAMGRGYRSAPYPNRNLLRRIRELGGEILINGDSHSAATLKTGYELSVELARAAGFDHVLRMRASGWEEVAL